MGLDTALILDTEWAYDVAVSEARWREDYASWETERAYRADKYTAELKHYQDQITYINDKYRADVTDRQRRIDYIEETYKGDKEYYDRRVTYNQEAFEVDTAYRDRLMAYNVEKETRRYQSDLDQAHETVKAKRAQMDEISITNRGEIIKAEIESQKQMDNAREQAAVAKVNTAAFGAGRSSQLLLRQIAAGGAEAASQVTLLAEVQEDIRQQQQYNLAITAAGAINTVSPFLEPVAPKEVLKAVDPSAPVKQAIPTEAIKSVNPETPTAPISYRPPIYVKPLEPNLEGFGKGVTEDTYINAAPAAVQSIGTEAPTAGALVQQSVNVGGGASQSGYIQVDPKETIKTYRLTGQTYKTSSPGGQYKMLTTTEEGGTWMQSDKGDNIYYAPGAALGSSAYKSESEVKQFSIFNTDALDALESVRQTQMSTLQSGTWREDY